MTAKTVFEVYKALDHEEQIKLYNLVKAHINDKFNVKKKKQNLLNDFTVEDGIRYLIKNVINKPRKI